MKCKNADLLINKYIDGEITEDEAVLLNTHLKECPSCKETFMLYDTLFADMDKLQTPAPPDGFDAVVMSRIAELEPSKFNLGFREKVASVIFAAFAAFLCIGSMLIINRDAVMSFLYSSPSLSGLAEMYAPVVQSFTAQTAVIQNVLSNIMSITNATIANASGLIVGVMGILCAFQFVLLRRHKKSKR